MSFIAFPNWSAYSQSLPPPEVLLKANTGDPDMNVKFRSNSLDPLASVTGFTLDHATNILSNVEETCTWWMNNPVKDGFKLEEPVKVI